MVEKRGNVEPIAMCHYNVKHVDTILCWLLG